MKPAAVLAGVLALTGRANAAPHPDINAGNAFLQAYLATGNQSVSGIDQFNQTSAQVASSNETILSSDPTILLADEKDKVPIWELPGCYQECIAEHHAHVLGVGDVRELSTHEFCWSHRRDIATWIVVRLQYCFGRECKFCHPECQAQSNEWFERACQRGNL
ncbi:hypothetical protein F4780DRAFT_763307 [Xylariomycetidae sp. FL0641]|nr:hypothetical protein F4780DRAFT_763307 [Xylariomycetidae sp. FL0641]